MSRASKITLGMSTLFAIGSTIFVHVVQDIETEQIRQGPIKDAERMNEKTKRKLMMNNEEHIYQQELRKKYEEMQPLNGKIITKDTTEGAEN
ncbi:hypothetical protein QEN19_003067 [Hanseniaspora menglaensis]